MKIEMNDPVRVTLSSFGAKAYNDYHKDVPKQYWTPMTEDSEIAVPLWELMSIFGPHISHGADPVFYPHEIETL